MSSVRRYRRCGWGWVQMTGEQVAAAARGPLPGPRQTNNRAELWALLHIIQHSTGRIIYWTDSAVLCRGWYNRRFSAKRHSKGNSDIRRRIKQAIQQRGGDHNDIMVKHTRSHLSLEGSLERQ
eukprot:3061310-Pyramimonas_sp.AAC.1